jgi:hypothetical protein
LEWRYPQCSPLLVVWTSIIKWIFRFSIHSTRQKEISSW